MGRSWRRGALRCGGMLLATAVVVALGCDLARAQQAPVLSGDEAAAIVLSSARRAYNEKSYPAAAERFREFLKQYAGHKDAAAARWGLALSLLEGPAKDYEGALQPLEQIVGVGDFPDRPLVLYYMGLAQRGLGLASLAQIAAKPNEAAHSAKKANQRFQQAATRFAESATALSARLKVPLPADTAQLPADFEWTARARCDQAEMLLQLQKAKEARAVVEPLADDAAWSKSRYRGLALYYLGHACFSLSDYLAAGRALSQLAPFQDPVYGVHARYLLARTHHLADERPEAAAHYEAVLAGYDAEKKAAQKLLADGNALKDNPEERARLDVLVKTPPDHIARATFYWGVLLYEDVRFADALARFTAFAAQYPASPLVAEAQLRQGFCQVQLKQFADAVKTLTTLQDHSQLSDQARWWLARAQVGAADPKNLDAYLNALKPAIENLRTAADRAKQKADKEPEAKLRRGDILLELGDTQQLARQYTEAATTFQLALTEKNNPERLDEALQRQATALHLAGKYKESDDLCAKFQQTHPKSSLFATVLFRYAENACLAAVAASENANLPNREQELTRLFGEAIKRYQQLLASYSEFAQANLARQGLATCFYRLGKFDEAIGILAAIPDAERLGELASVPYLLADCLLRTLPANADDALSAARLNQQLEDAVKLLDGFVAQPPGPQTPDAFLKLASAHSQIAGILAEPKEREKSLAAARQTYEKLIQQFDKHPLQPTAVLERAKCLAEAGDMNGSMNELRRFQNDPLKNTPVAPLALVRLAGLLRAQSKAAEAATLLTQCRATYEAAMLGDPSRAAWAPLVQLHLGISLRESTKLAEARAIFENIVKQFAARPEAAEAAWCAGQCRKEESLARWDAARVTLARADAKPEEKTAATATVQDCLKQLGETAQAFQDSTAALAKTQAGSEPHLRMLYEAALCSRLVGDAEIEQTRRKQMDDQLKKLQDEAAKAGKTLDSLRLPDVPLTAIAIQPAEQKARDFYKSLIAAGTESPLANESRFELAEMHCQRAEWPAAAKLLTEALAQEPSPDLAERVRLRLGSCYFEQDNPPAAIAQFEAVLQNAKSPWAAEARYRAGECWIKQKDWGKAIQTLQPFRDQQPLQNLPGVSDLALVRLAHAFAAAGQWDPSRQVCETLTQRFPQSPWLHDARYGIGWALQNARQYDQAVQAYGQITSRTAAEIAAKAQLQIGLCRLEQNRPAEAANALLMVPFTYDYPELSSLALCEAARAFVAQHQPREAARLLERVVKDHPESPWAEVAKERLKGVDGAHK